MARLEWDKTGERYYEAGVSKGVLYLPENGVYSTGVAWNGLTSVNESTDGADISPYYADNIKYLNLMSNGDFKATIEAYTYPDEFAECDGSAEIATGVTIGQQPRKPFGFSYVTKIGNDTDSIEKGYKIHLVYGCMASPTDKSYGAINESIEPITFSWEVSTTPVAVAGHKPTAHIVIDSTKVAAAKLTALETILYGGENATARLPLPEEIATMFATA